MSAKTKKQLVLRFDGANGPIYPSDGATGEPETGIAVVDNDRYLAMLNLECGLNILAYLGAIDGSANAPSEALLELKNEILDGIRLIKALLDELNDGTFEVVDLVTPELV